MGGDRGVRRLRRDGYHAARPCPCPAGLLVAVLYCPWLLTHRATYFYYMVPVVPYLAILLAFGLERLAAARPRLRYPAIAYVVLCVALGIAWLPFAMGGHAPYTLYQALTWLPSWK